MADLVTLTQVGVEQAQAEEPALVLVAREILAGRRHPDEFDAVFAETVVYGQRPARPGALVAEVAGYGWWTFVFSTTDRLAYAGECGYFVMTGADLLEHLPVGVGVGVMLDVGDAHRFPVLSRMVPPTVLAAMRHTLLHDHGGAGDITSG